MLLCSARGPIEFESLRNNIILECEKAEERLISRFFCVLIYLRPTTEEVNVVASAPAFVCSFVCVQDYSKTRAWIWMKCYMLSDVGTWTNWLTFEPNPDHSSDAGPGLLSPIAYALKRGNPYWAHVAAMRFF